MKWLLSHFHGFSRLSFQELREIFEYSFPWRLPTPSGMSCRPISSEPANQKRLRPPNSLPSAAGSGETGHGAVTAEAATASGAGVSALAIPTTSASAASAPLV